MKKILAKEVSYGYVSPCSLGWAAGVLTGLNLFVHYLAAQLNWEFLWYNYRTFGYMLNWMPDWLLPTTNSSALLPVIALLYGMVAGGVVGLLGGLIYNWAQRKCGCRWCRI